MDENPVDVYCGSLVLGLVFALPTAKYESIRGKLRTYQTTHYYISGYSDKILTHGEALRGFQRLGMSNGKDYRTRIKEAMQSIALEFGERRILVFWGEKSFEGFDALQSYASEYDVPIDFYSVDNKLSNTVKSDYITCNEIVLDDIPNIVVAKK
jgi:hypothetical protein